MREFTIGGVIGRTFALIQRHFGDFAVAAAILVFLPSLVSSASLTTTRTFDAEGQIRDTSTHTQLLGGGGSIVVWLTSLVLYGIVVHAALGDLRGERFTLGTGLGASFRAFLPNLGISILNFLALMVGFMLLIVPGVMLMCAWLVVVPSNMAEGTGVMGAFGRSRALTSGHRWSLFGLLLLYGMAVLIVGLIAMVGATGSVASGGGFWPIKIVSAVLSAAISLVGSAGAVACYIELRQREGGVLSSDLVESFS